MNEIPADFTIRELLRLNRDEVIGMWLFEYDGTVDLDKATTKEVAQTAWLDREEIKELYDRGALVYTLGYFFEIDDFGEKND